MKNGIISKIVLLVFLIALGGCAASGTPLTDNIEDQPILSAAEAQSMIRVTVRTLPPPAGQTIGNETIVAAID
jgi:hypothetical protein